MILPWNRKNQEAEQAAQAAEQELRRAKVDRVEVQRIAQVSKDLHQQNGFLEAIRYAMGVHK